MANFLYLETYHDSLYFSLKTHKMRLFGIAPTLTAFTFIYTLLVLLLAREAINISKNIEIAKEFTVKMNEISKKEQSISKEIKEKTEALENKTIKPFELTVVIDDIFKRIVNEFSENDTKISYTFSISSIKTRNETYRIQINYRISIRVIEQYFYISSEIEGEKGVEVNLLEDSAQS